MFYAQPVVSYNVICSLTLSATYSFYRFHIHSLGLLLAFSPVCLVGHSANGQFRLKAELLQYSVYSLI